MGTILGAHDSLVPDNTSFSDKIYSTFDFDTLSRLGAEPEVCDDYRYSVPHNATAFNNHAVMQ